MHRSDFFSPDTDAWVLLSVHTRCRSNTVVELIINCTEKLQINCTEKLQIPSAGLYRLLLWFS